MLVGIVVEMVKEGFQLSAEFLERAPTMILEELLAHEFSISYNQIQVW